MGLGLRKGYLHIYIYMYVHMFMCMYMCVYVNKGIYLYHYFHPTVKEWGQYPN